MAGWMRVVAVLVWLAALSAAARAEAEVDVALVLAVDVSYSMDPDEQALQRQGFAEAFRSTLVHEAIRGGMTGRITVTYVEWAGAGHQQVVVPWTVIDGPESALAFADRLAGQPIGRVFYTSISGAIDFGVGLLAQKGVEAAREVIDVSGDGPNNAGRPVTEARDAAAARGITVNGLPLMLKRPSSAWDIEDLDLYYRDCVIGGPGAFIVPVRERSQFADAIRTKIVREIADLPARVQPARIESAQSEPEIDCLVGERLRRQRSWE